MICRVAFVVVLAPVLLSAQPKPTPTVRNKAGSDAPTYRNTSYGFRYRIPLGWVDRTQEMQLESAATQGGSGKDGVLLALFERPPQAAGDTVNAAVLIASESVASYPGLKTASDYLGPLNELTTAKGFKPEGDPSTIVMDGRELVRADFVRSLSDQLAMHQATLVLLQKGQIVSFTFVAGTTTEIDELLESLSFARGKPDLR